MKLFLATWLLVSIMAASIAFAPHPQPPQPTKTVLVMRINGQIDGALLDRWNAFAASHTISLVSINYLVIDMNSSGGYYLDSLSMSSTFKRLQAGGTTVYFFAEQRCTSGCFILASAANSIYATRDTKIGFNHNASDVASIYPQIEAILYANGRIKLDGITTNPLLNREYQPCLDMKDPASHSSNPFVDGCFKDLNAMLAWFKPDFGTNYKIINASLSANAKLGSA